MLSNLATSFTLVLQPELLIAILLATVLGYIIGAMPGLGPSLGVALLIPFTYGMPPVTAIVALVALYVAAEYGGAITAIMLNTPGTAAAVATSWDGYPMASSGQAGFALHVSIISSGLGAFFTAVLLMMTAVPLSEFALRFGPTEYCALALLGLSLVSSLGGDSPLRGLLALSIGVFFATIGTDPESGVPRFAFTPALLEGIPLVPALLGLYALSESLLLLEKEVVAKMQVKVGSVWKVSIRRYKPLWFTIFRSSVIGYVIGVIPGAGPSIASLLAYNEAKRASKGEDKERFGKGNPKGVAASEAANNSAAIGAFAPMLALGIPGSATAAIVIGALMIHGIQPGPLLFVRHPEIPYSIFAALMLSVPLMVLVGLLGARLWVQVVRVPNTFLSVAVISISIIGAYASENSMFPVYVTLVFGALGYVFRKVNLPLAPIVLALVLVPMAETNYRRALIIADGSHSIFLTQPITLVLLTLAVLSFLGPLYGSLRKGIKQTAEQED